MSEKVRTEQEKELSPKQQKIIAELVSGKTIRDAARAVEINEKTAHTWMKQPLFLQELKEAKQIAYEERLETLKSGVGIALKTLLKHMTNEETPANVQVRASQIWLDHSRSVHQNDKLELMHAEILKKLDELGVRS